MHTVKNRFLQIDCLCTFHGYSSVPAIPARVSPSDLEPASATLSTSNYFSNDKLAENNARMGDFSRVY
jgi:hypothetical protein